jgi:hypothetical protein
VCRASDKCQKEKRKTINGDDLLYLARYREVITKTFLIFVFLVNLVKGGKGNSGI